MVNKARKSRFCSRLCVIDWLAKEKRKNRKIKYCKQCSKPISNRNIYCSSKCLQEYRYQYYIRAWLQGNKSGGSKSPTRSSGYKVSSYVARWLKETRGCKCEECGWCRVHPISEEIPLQIHHIDGDGKNNTSENLKLLCAACHTLTENWGNRKST